MLTRKLNYIWFDSDLFPDLVL